MSNVAQFKPSHTKQITEDAAIAVLKNNIIWKNVVNEARCSTIRGMPSLGDVLDCLSCIFGLDKVDQIARLDIRKIRDEATRI